MISRESNGRWVHRGPCFILAVLLGSIAGDDPLPKLQDRPQRLSVAKIENVFRLGTNLYSGGEPGGEEGLTALKRLGIKTIISVDGSSPDVETARKLGLRYVHLPVGYDGIAREQVIKIIKSAQTLPGPIYVHCHHGIHRGPTAAGLCGIALQGWDREQAISWMKQVGTSSDYQGLFATVDKFTLPAPEELAKAGSDFPEKADTPALVEMMVAIDKQWDVMKGIKAADFRSPISHPDIDPSHEALQLKEQFEELTRQAMSSGQADDRVRLARESAEKCSALEVSLRGYSKEPTATSRKRVQTRFDAVAQSCKTCHSRHRDK